MGDCGTVRYWPTVERFYSALADATGRPLHRWHRTHGHIWIATAADANGTVVYHQALVMPYVGDFDRRHWSEPARPIPRIHLNDGDTNPPRAMLASLADGDAKSFRRFNHRLELTCTMDELPTLASWLVGFAGAVAGNRVDLLPPPPVALERREPVALGDAYLWTAAAAAEYAPYERRMQRLNEMKRAVRDSRTMEIRL